MSERTTQAKIKNFTPLLDELVKEFGVVTAAVWGRIWRYAQQEYGVCQASLDKIANELHISRRTVIRHISKLCIEGYIYDHTPTLRNKPHTYSITNKARIIITIEGVTESHSRDEGGVTESPKGVTESPADSDRKSLEETIKKQIKKDKQEGVKFPEKFQNDEFYSTWVDFQEHRKQIKSKMTKLAKTKMMNKLAKVDLAMAIELMDDSIANGWKGVFPPENGNKPKVKKRLPEGV
ncbi:MAG: helix-turn-helix domain-containing protein [Candidatus Thorarchaeota archaeon]|jgi:hypothetical protein